MFLKIHAYNLPQIIAAVKAHGEVWFHGDGNIYKTDKDSKDHGKFANPKQTEAQYRFKFTSTSQIPAFKNGATMAETERINEASVKQLEELLLKSRQKEMDEERKTIQTTNVPATVPFDESMLPTDSQKKLPPTPAKAGARPPVPGKPAPVDTSAEDARRAELDAREQELIAREAKLAAAETTGKEEGKVKK